MTRGDQTRGSSRLMLWGRVTLWNCVFGSGSGFEGDLIAEAGELADVVTHAGVGLSMRRAWHWEYAADLARRYPQVTVDPAPLYIKDGNTTPQPG
jgi:hypothetical protein